jgi:sigma-B regulation protein RsbU (phosphoserine phosphatase)
MNKFRMALSLRYKLLLLLTIIPAVCLTLYLLMATELFKKDKIAYVFDSSVAVSRALSVQTRLTVQSLFDAIKPMVEGYDYTVRDFSKSSKDLFDQSSRVKALRVFQSTSSGKYVYLGTLMEPSNPALAQVFANQEFMDRSEKQALQNQIFLSGVEGQPGLGVFSFRIDREKDHTRLLVTALIDVTGLESSFNNGGLYVSYLWSPKTGKLFGPPESLNTQILEQVGGLPEGTAEFSEGPHRVTLMSYSKLGLSDFLVLSTVDKDKALKAVDVLIKKSALFFIALLASTLLISLFASSKLTSALRELFEATKKIAAGDFSVRVTPRSKDEVGGLAESFNWMAEKVSQLMMDTAEKARMENELATVKTVQETLFPSENLSDDRAQVVGHFQPASECGGDWWSYTLTGNKLYLWIGDATGHGAPAALITSAARSAAAIVESMPEMSPAQALKVMNHAIHQTSRSKINMTFFLGCLDLTSGELTYSNASHDPPYLLRKPAEGKLKKKNLEPLMEVNGPRLGERNNSEYQVAQVKMEPGDQIFFYTDGIMDVQNPAGENLGERSFLKALINAINTGEDLDQRMHLLREDIEAYRQGAELIDDVTLFLLHYGPKEHQQKVAA